MCVTFICLHVSIYTLLSAALSPPPMSPAQTTHTHTLSVSPPLSEASSCKWHCVGQWMWVVWCLCAVLVVLAVSTTLSCCKQYVVHNMQVVWALVLCHSVNAYTYNGYNCTVTLCTQRVRGVLLCSSSLQLSPPLP